MAIDHDVFLSFARADEALGRAISRYLRASGLRVALAGELEEGADVPWLATVERAVSRARKLVIVVSDETPATWLRAELDFAGRQLHLEVIPLIREGFSHADDFQALSLFTPMRLPGDRRLLDQRLEGLVNRVQREGSPLRPAIDREARPFPTLRPYGVHDGRWFFGRSRELAEATTGLGFGAGKSRWLRVEGAAGCGKTSFARAGVVDAVLRGAVVDGPGEWFVAAFRPGGDPFAALNAAIEAALAGHVKPGEVEAAIGPEGLADLLARSLPEDAGLLLVIDHLDDVAAAWEQGSPTVDAFDTQLAAALKATSGRLMLVTTHQSGQARRTMDVLNQLATLLEQARVVALGGLSRSALRQVIEQPLQMIGRRWPPALVDRLVEDASRMSGAPGALCWILDRLLTDKTPTEAWYEALGGLWHGPGRAFDTRLAALGDEERERALTLILALVGAGRGREDLLPGQTFAEAVVIAGGGRAGEELVRSLTRGAGSTAPEVLLRLDPDGQHVRLAHADLLRLWPRLRGLLASHRAVLERRTDVERAARAWQMAARNPALLPEGPWLSRDTGADLPASQLSRLGALLGTTARAYVRAAEEAEEARKAARAAAETQERAHAAAERAAEQAAAARRETLWRKRALHRGTAALVAAGLAVVVSMLAAQRQSSLETARDEVGVLTTARDERDSVIGHLRKEKAGLEGERTTLTDGLRRARTQAQQAAAEAEQLLEHGVQGALIADEILGLVPGEVGPYNRRTFFTKLVEAAEGRVNANPDQDRLRLLLARILVQTGDVFSVTGPTQRAPEAFSRAVAILDPLARREQPAPAFLATQALAHLRAAEFHLRPRTAASRDPALAVPHLEQAIQVSERLVNLYPQQPAHRLGVAEARARLSQVHLSFNRVDAAQLELKRAVDEARTVAQAADKDFDRALTVGRWLGQLADLEARNGEAGSARTHYAEAVTWLEKALTLAPAEEREPTGALADRYRARGRALLE